MNDPQTLGQWIVNHLKFNSEVNDLYNMSNQELKHLLHEYKKYLFSLKICPECDTTLKTEVTVMWMCPKCGWCYDGTI